MMFAADPACRNAIAAEMTLPRGVFNGYEALLISSAYCWNPLRRPGMAKPLFKLAQIDLLGKGKLGFFLCAEKAGLC